MIPLEDMYTYSGGIKEEKVAIQWKLVKLIQWYLIYIIRVYIYCGGIKEEKTVLHRKQWSIIAWYHKSVCLYIYMEEENACSNS